MDEEVDAETAQPADARERSWFDADLFAPLVLVVAFGVGSWATTYGMRKRGAIDDLYDRKVANADLDVWIALLGAISGVAVCMCAISVVRLFVLAREHGGWPHRVTLGWAVTVVGVVAAVVGSLIAASVSADELAGLVATVVGSVSDSPVTIDGDRLNRDVGMATRPITLATAALAVPGLMYFSALRSIARRGRVELGAGSLGIADVLALRTRLVFQTTGYGSLLTLIVIATGMRRRALLAFDPMLNIPIEQVVMYGLVFAALLGLFHFSASSGIDDLAARVVDTFAPLPQPGDEAVADRLAERAAVASAVGASSGRQTFEASVVILAPLVTALISAALS